MSSDRFLLQYSNWDWIPVIEAVVHLGLVIAWLFAFDSMSWPVFIVLGLIYALSISWSLNSISHNFIHNAYFKSETLNYYFSFLLSLTIVFSQAMYHFVHTRHHSGNSDVPDKNGDTVDHISIYKYGKDGKPENVWSYTLMNYFRDDPREFLISVPVQTGNSGGPLVNEFGNVVGIVVAKLDALVALKVTGDLPQNVNYAVKGSYALSFLESIPEVGSRLKEPHPEKSRSFGEVVKEAEAAAALVLVY